MEMCIVHRILVSLAPMRIHDIINFSINISSEILNHRSSFESVPGHNSSYEVTICPSLGSKCSV